MGVRRCRDVLIALRNMYGRAKVEGWAGIHVQAAHVSTPPLIAGGKKKSVLWSLIYLRLDSVCLYWMIWQHCQVWNML